MNRTSSVFPLTVVLALVCGVVAAQETTSAAKSARPFTISAEKECCKTITSSRSEYDILMGGTVDMDNTMTRSYSGFDVAFQPNLSLEIANTGDTPVVNPRLIVNDKRKWWCLDELLKEILAGAENDQEKALLIWDFCRKRRHHDSPLFTHDELHDPVKMLCIYGAGLCDDSAAIGCSLLYHAGLNESKYGKNPKTRALHGHVMCEAYLDNGYQFLDIDEDAVYLDRENERPVSGDALARDHDMAKREHAYGPIFQGWDVGERAASLFGTDDGAGFRAVAGHRMDITLRPGEKIVYRWDNRGKYASDGAERRRYWGNSLLHYEPRLEFGQHESGAVRAVDVVAADPAAAEGRLAGATKDAHLVYEIKSPYVICGGSVEASFVGLHPDDCFVISLSLDGAEWKPVFERRGDGKPESRVALDEPLDVHNRPPKYGYFIRVSLQSAAPKTAQLSRLAIQTDVMASPHALPRLSVGRNHVVYTDDTEAPHEVRVAHRWRESDNIIPPPPPAKPSFPEDGAVVRQSTFAFRWPAVANARRYHIQVSRYENMKLPYRTAFDLVVDSTEHGSPFAGMFSPDTDYYWRVRSQNEHGVWGAWSDVWRFRWEGPRAPIGLESLPTPDGGFTISWRPNPRGPQPASYEVYGSDERGFSVSKQAYEVKGLGKQPANFLGATTSTEMAVVSANPTHANMNRCYYRVVAVDRNGVSSGSSDYVELPHPFVYSVPPRVASVGQPYRYEIKTLRSLGDLQHRYTPPTSKFWEREEYEFRLAKGPAWLQLDAKSGVLAGVPGADDVGEKEIEIVSVRKYPYEVSPQDESGNVFQKTDSRFQASHRQTFKLRIE